VSSTTNPDVFIGERGPEPLPAESNGQVANATGLGRFAPLASMGVVGLLGVLFYLSMTAQQNQMRELTQMLREQYQEVRRDHRSDNARMAKELQANTAAIQSLTLELRRIEQPKPADGP